jgi:alpha-tubulin suppressor-like RCC1 family protein
VLFPICCLIYLLDDHKVYICGYNSNGEHGHHDNGQSNHIYYMDHIPYPIKSIYAGHFSSYFVTLDDCVLCCGCNESKCLGVGPKYDADHSLFQIIKLDQFDNQVKDVFVGAYHWVVKTKSGQLWSAGRYGYSLLMDEIDSGAVHNEFKLCTAEQVYGRTDAKVSQGAEFSVVYYQGK